MVRAYVGKKLPSRNNDYIRRYLEFITVCPTPRLRQAVIASAPAAVIKTIANGVYNLQRGDVRLTPTQVRKLRRLRPLVNKLVDRKVGLGQKRRLLVQSGRGAGLAILISSVVGVLGNLILNKLIKR